MRRCRIAARLLAPALFAGLAACGSKGSDAAQDWSRGAGDLDGQANRLEQRAAALVEADFNAADNATAGGVANEAAAAPPESGR